MKKIWKLLVVFVPALILATYALPAAADTPDLVFVQVPVTAEPAAPSPGTRLDTDHYVEGCRIVRFSAARKKNTPLTEGFLSACDPSVSFDGKHILFAGKKSNHEPWHIWRMDANGKNKIQLTEGEKDCVSPLYVGSLFHLNDKKPTDQFAYLSDNHLYTRDRDGKYPRRISYNPYPEYSPEILPNGRILYSSVKHNGYAANAEKILDLLAVNIDGTDLMGFLTGADLPGNKKMVRVVPGKRIYFILSKVNRWLGGGSLGYVSSRRPAHSYRQLAPANKGLYHSPCPLPKGKLAAAYRDKTKNSPFALLLMNPETGKHIKKLYADPKYHCIDAHPLVSRPIARGRSSFVAHQQDSGILYCVNAYISEDPEIKQLPPGSIKQVRVLEGVTEKVKDKTVVVRRILGVAPVETDGSFHIRVPARTPVAFQLLDKDGLALASQSSWTWVMPRESRGCIGCHENRELAPPNQLSQAIVKPAVVLTPPPEKRRTIDFFKEIYPFYRFRCAGCHGNVDTMFAEKLIPGSARKSPLARRLLDDEHIRTNDPGMRQPHNLWKKEQLELFLQWIDLGAYLPHPVEEL